MLIYLSFKYKLLIYALSEKSIRRCELHKMFIVAEEGSRQRYHQFDRKYLLRALKECTKDDLLCACPNNDCTISLVSPSSSPKRTKINLVQIEIRII